MSVPLKTYKQVESRVNLRLKAPRHGRYWKLQGSEAKVAARQYAVDHLLRPDAVLPYPLRRRLKMKRVGNITLCNTTPTLYEAWMRVYRNYTIAPGGFWFEPPNAATDSLIDLALDYAREKVCEATADVGGTGADGKLLDPQLSELIARLSDSGQNQHARTPERERERQKIEAAHEARERLDVEENTKFRQALNADPWLRKRPDNQLRALNLILFEPGMKGSDIATQCGVSPGQVSKIRSHVEELADKILTIPEESARSVTEEEVRAFYDAHQARIQQPYEGVAENIREYLARQVALPPVEGAGVDAPDASPDAVFDDEPEPLAPAEVHLKDSQDGEFKKGDIAELSGDLTFGALEAAHDAPDIEPSDYSENVAGSYARMRANERVHGGGGGRRKYNELELVTGNVGRKPTYKEIVEMSKPATSAKSGNGRFTDMAARHLRQKAKDSGFDIDGALQVIDARIAQKVLELKIAGAELDALMSVRRSEVLWLWSDGLAGADWVLPWCMERKVSPDDLLGENKVSTTDEALSASIIGPTPAVSDP